MTTTDTAPRLSYPLREACELLGIPHKTGKRIMLTTGQLVEGVPCWKVGRFWFVQRAGIQALLGIGGDQ